MGSTWQDRMMSDGVQVLATTESVCPECLARIPAQRVMRGDDVFLRKTCPEHGDFETIVWRGQPGLDDWARPKIPAHPSNPFTLVECGCPLDCGLCPDHRQQTCCALLEVTQRCNLRCPVCFADAGGSSDDPPLSTIDFWYRRLLDLSGGPCNIYLSGGEPTLRDDLPQIIRMGRELGFSYFQLNTNGLRLAAEPEYLDALKEAGLSCVFLQFDGTDDRIYRQLRDVKLLDRKIATIEQCALAGVGVVLVPTLAPGVNVDNIGATVSPLAIPRGRSARSADRPCA
jgi:hypothetical protein